MKRLTALRMSRRWTRTELGRQARLHPSRVGTIESGRVIPYDVELGRLAKALRWQGDPADLLEEVDDASAAR
jgi:transcriptional regulator with XRE-family HTH domain